METVVIDYNAGNTQSVIFALERLGVSASLSRSKEQILAADRVIFPGVGRAGAAMSSLREADLVETIKSIKSPFLGICLGLQLMCEGSEEDRTEGLGIFSTKVKKFEKKGEMRVPHMGWNFVQGQGALFKGIPEESRFYFVHSYYAESSSEQTIGSSQYGPEFSSALADNNYYGVQFHPEKSGDVGEIVLNNFLEIEQ